MGAQHEWRSAVRADSERVQASLALLGAQLAEWKPELGDRQLVERQYQASQARDALLRQNQSQIEQMEGMLYNWQQINRLAYQDVNWTGRLEGAWTKVSQVVPAVWNFELITVDDTIVVEGREISGKRSVTLGKLVQVLLILVLGLWLTGRISAYARRRLLARYSGDESAALLWLRLASIGMGIGLVVLALLTAHIPLTAFAFMGGALALGIGFGAQNILNNFISGMILLVEKPIKLGDIVEVDGIRGRVHDIGSRCCQVQRFDGIDMLIPNSVFLERTVTNWTLSDQLLRFSVTVGIAYGSPVETAMRLVREAVTEHMAVLKVPHAAGAAGRLRRQRADAARRLLAGHQPAGQQPPGVQRNPSEHRQTLCRTRHCDPLPATRCPSGQPRPDPGGNGGAHVNRLRPE